VQLFDNKKVQPREILIPFVVTHQFFGIDALSPLQLQCRGDGRIISVAIHTDSRKRVEGK
jgi:hypothetical protein